MSEPSSLFWSDLMGNRGGVGEEVPTSVVKACGPVKEKDVILEKKWKGRIMLIKKKKT